MGDIKRRRNLEDRIFLHDIATPLTIVRLTTKRIHAILDGTAAERDKPRGLELLKRLEDALEKMENIHADFKSAVHQRESDDERDKAA